MPSDDFYESQRALGEYLHFHYGSAEEFLPYGFGPSSALEYPARCVSEFLVAGGSQSVGARALDLGCAVGRSSFELARQFGEVIGIDYSQSFIDAAAELALKGDKEYFYLTEGAISRSAVANIGADIDRTRVSFEVGDGMGLREGLGAFDLVLMANLIDRLVDPMKCLDQLPGLVRPGGRLILTSPYTWLTEYTPRENWLGGYLKDGAEVSTHDGLVAALSDHFELLETKDLPFLIREHQRKFQWSVAEGTLWQRKG
jgi:putative 4-mercaptohistidine N1-methyltranferase